jgi:hypothetical protein
MGGADLKIARMLNMHSSMPSNSQANTAIAKILGSNIAYAKGIDLGNKKDSILSKIGMSNTGSTRGASIAKQREWGNMPIGEKILKRMMLQDRDKDNTPDVFDCQPKNPLKQDDKSTKKNMEEAFEIIKESSNVLMRITKIKPTHERLLDAMLEEEKACTAQHLLSYPFIPSTWTKKIQEVIDLSKELASERGYVWQEKIDKGVVYYRVSKKSKKDEDEFGEIKKREDEEREKEKRKKEEKKKEKKQKMGSDTHPSALR